MGQIPESVKIEGDNLGRFIRNLPYKGIIEDCMKDSPTLYFQIMPEKFKEEFEIRLKRMAKTYKVDVGIEYGGKGIIISLIDPKAKPKPIRKKRVPPPKPEVSRDLKTDDPDDEELNAVKGRRRLKPLTKINTSANSTMTSADTREKLEDFALRKAKADAEEKELKVLKMREELVDRSVVDRELYDKGKEIRMSMLGVPDKAIDELMACSDRDEAHNILYKIIEGELLRFTGE